MLLECFGYLAFASPDNSVRIEDQLEIASGGVVAKV